MDSADNRLTGLTDVLLWIRRRSDGQYFDFAGGWGANRTQHQMVEMDSTNNPGVYEYYFDTDGLGRDDYFYDSESATSATGPWQGWIYIGGVNVDQVNDVTIVGDGSTIPFNV